MPGKRYKKYMEIAASKKHGSSGNFRRRAIKRKIILPTGGIFSGKGEMQRAVEAFKAIREKDMVAG